MRAFHVEDSDIDAVYLEKYDIAFFASGYESRCIYVSKIINPTIVKKSYVLGFLEQSHQEQRLKNDDYLMARWNSKPILTSSDDEECIYSILNEHLNGTVGSIRILVDYSSMSRIWYTAILNWSRLAVAGRDVVIDFIYAMGVYGQEKSPMVIRNMASIPGCEGRAFRLRDAVAVFGLGFHGLAALCVLDRLEVDTVYAFLASPGSSSEYVKRTEEINKDLIKDHRTEAVFELPLASLATCYRFLADIIAPHRQDEEITLVPMGPKPHVLASILVAMRFQEVACLRVSGTPDLLDIKAAGDIVVTRVVIYG